MALALERRVVGGLVRLVGHLVGPQGLGLVSVDRRVSRFTPCRAVCAGSPACSRAAPVLASGRQPLGSMSGSPSSRRLLLRNAALLTDHKVTRVPQNGPGQIRMRARLWIDAAVVR